MIITFSAEPKGDHHRQLLEFCAEHCDQASLVARDVDWLQPAALQLLERLRAFQLSVVEASKWPGTTLVGHTASVYRYAVHPTLIRLLEQAVTGLYDWIQPDRPEDLSFCRPDGKPFLASIAHERDGYLDLTSEEFAKLRRRTSLNASTSQTGNMRVEGFLGR